MNDIKLPELNTEPVAGLPSVIIQPSNTPITPIKDPEQKEAPTEPAPILFELRLTETKVTGGSIPVTWCIDRDWLLKHNNREHYVLLCSAPPNKSGDIAEWRGYAKLSNLMAYVTFYRPGENRIIGCVVDDKDYVERWMAREPNRTGWMIEAMNFGYWDSSNKFLIDSRWPSINNHIDLELPQECFAKEPSILEKKWVNFFFRTKAVDQCEFRRRRILAYTVQPIAFLIWAILYSLFILCTQLLYLVCGTWVTFGQLGTTDVYIAKKTDFLKIKSWGMFDWILVPVPILLIVSLILSHINLLFLLLPIGGLIGIVSFFLLFLYLSGMWVKRTKSTLQKPYCPEELELLQCYSDKKIASIKDLPKGKRTIKLRFQDINSRYGICKPFAR
jgi:hypothetical protein